jgi:hypothetical protein
MRAFKINLNGKRICVAGAGADGVLTTHIDYVGQGSGHLRLAVTGLFTKTDEHAIWATLGLKVGDKVQVTVVETDLVDKPKKRYRPDSKSSERNQKAYVRAWAKKFGWKILSRPKKSK